MQKSSHRVWGITLLTIALLIYAVDETIAKKIVGSMGDGQDKNIFEYSIDFFFGKMGMKPLEVVLVALGGFYLVIGDLVSSFLSEKFVESVEKIKLTVENGFSQISETVRVGSSAMGKEMIVSWIENGKGDAEDYREIGMESMRKHYYEKSNSDIEYVKYLVDTFADRTLSSDGIHREQLNVKGTAKKVKIIDAQATDNFSWTEVKDYFIVANKIPTIHTIRSATKFPVSSDDLIALFKRCELNISVDGKVECDLRKHRDKCITELLASEKGYVSDDGVLKVYYDGCHVNIFMEIAVTLNKKKTKVHVSEHSFMDVSERVATLTFNHPVKNFHYHLHFVDGFEITNVIAGPVTYCQGGDTGAEIKDWPSERSYVTFTADKWVLPGIALVVRWNPIANNPSHDQTSVQGVVGAAS